MDVRFNKSTLFPFFRRKKQTLFHISVFFLSLNVMPESQMVNVLRPSIIRFLILIKWSKELPCGQMLLSSIS